MPPTPRAKAEGPLSKEAKGLVSLRGTPASGGVEVAVGPPPTTESKKSKNDEDGGVAAPLALAFPAETSRRGSGPEAPVSGVAPLSAFPFEPLPSVGGAPSLRELCFLATFLNSRWFGFG